jgi:hypothetical protein
MKFSNYLILFLFLILFSCEKEKNTSNGPNTSIEAVYLEPMYFGKCFGSLTVNDTTGVIVKTNQQYQALGDTCRMLWLSSVKCDTAKLPEIDFEKYSLIGKYTSGGGCSVTKSYNLEIDTLNYKYIYSIHLIYEGACDMYIMDMNWALVPAIPDYYQVEFRILSE